MRVNGGRKEEEKGRKEGGSWGEIAGCKRFHDVDDVVPISNLD